MKLWEDDHINSNHWTGGHIKLWASGIIHRCRLLRPVGSRWTPLCWWSNTSRAQTPEAVGTATPSRKECGTRAGFGIEQPPTQGIVKSPLSEVAFCGVMGYPLLEWGKNGHFSFSSSPSQLGFCGVSPHHGPEEVSGRNNSTKENVGIPRRLFSFGKIILFIFRCGTGTVTS